MQIKFYRIAANDPDEAAKELNGFLAAHKILTIQREFVQDGQGSFWAVAVEYLSSRPATEKTNSSRHRKDYKKELSPETFGLFSKLREWRKSMAEQHGRTPGLTDVSCCPGQNPVPWVLPYRTKSAVPCRCW